tara:strand:+ start:267 stop:470 length:204 start_codon:yes stop_codon:yes gene_type:complete
MKVGDLVMCPVDLRTGEMFSSAKTLAIIIATHENEPKVEVAYFGNESSAGGGVGVWLTEEIDLVNEG